MTTMYSKKEVHEAYLDVSSAMHYLAEILQANALAEAGIDGYVQLQISGWSYSFKFDQEARKGVFTLHPMLEDNKG